MAIDIKQWNHDFIEYAVTPEKVHQDQVDWMKEDNKIHAESNGYGQSHNWKKIGEVPFAVMYNYCLTQGVPVTRLSDFYTEDNGANMRKLLNEFNVFRVGNTPIGRRGVDKAKGFIIK